MAHSLYGVAESETSSASEAQTLRVNVEHPAPAATVRAGKPEPLSSEVEGCPNQRDLVDGVGADTDCKLVRGRRTDPYPESGTRDQHQALTGGRPEFHQVEGDTALDRPILGSVVSPTVALHRCSSRCFAVAWTSVIRPSRVVALMLHLVFRSVVQAVV
jgi:hypothetical protein